MMDLWLKPLVRHVLTTLGGAIAGAGAVGSSVTGDAATDAAAGAVMVLIGYVMSLLNARRNAQG